MALDPRAAAWVAALPAAAITLVAMLLLGPALGAWAFPDPHVAFFAPARQLHGVQREPTEQARFLISLAGPLLLVALTVLLARRAPAALVARRRALVLAVEVVGLLVVIGCFVAQRLGNGQFNEVTAPKPVVYFTLPSIAVAVAIAAAIVAGVRADRVRGGVTRWLAAAGERRVVVGVVLFVALVVTLLPAFNTDGSIEHAYEAVSYHLNFTYDETMAVLDGRSPLGNFVTQYAALWPYVLAGLMTVLGSSLAVFTGLLTVLTGVTLLALYDILRRLTRNAVVALALFLPLLATCAFRLHGPAVNRFSLVNYFGGMPLRYAGPFLLAWLIARHLDGARPWRVWPLFLAAGLVVLNNTDFGVPALAATVGALIWTRTRDRGAMRELAEAAAGHAAALGIVTALLLVRTGSTPDLSLLFRYARLFALGGFSMLPIRPHVGLYVVIFLTYVAAIGVATVRALRADGDRVLTGMLVWSGIFGLGSGSYYVGHSLSELLIDLFPAWALSVTLLALVTIRQLARTPRQPSPAQLACLVGFGLLVCSLAQTPAPWQQLRRIASSGLEPFAQPMGEYFVAQNAYLGESVLIVSQLGHRIAQNLKLRDVEPYTGAKSIFAREQLEESLAALKAAGGTRVFVQRANEYGNYALVLRSRFRLIAEGEGMALWLAR